MIMQRDIKGIHSSELTMEWQLSMCRLQHHQQKGETAMCIYSVLWKQIDLETSQRHPEARFPGSFGTFLAHLLLHPVCLHALWNHLSDTDTCCSHCGSKAMWLYPSSWWVGCFPEFKGGMELREWIYTMHWWLMSFQFLRTLGPFFAH